MFAKVDFLPIDNYSEKKKTARKIQATSNSSKTTGNITLVYFMQCRKLIFIDILSFMLHLFFLLPGYFYLLPLSFDKKYFIKSWFFRGSINHEVYSIGAKTLFPLVFFPL